MPEVATPERTLPHNLDAEKSVLGAILIHNDAFNHAAELIDSKDFFRDAHRRIFDKMVALSERGHAIDFITLKEELTRAGELDEIGGPSYIAALADGVPRSANVEYYARIVKEKSTLRSLIHSANKILTEAYEAELEPEVLLDEAERSIFAIAEGRIREGFVPLRDLVQTSFATIEKLQQSKGAISGVPSGFPDLDEMTTGFQPGDLVVVAARPSMGKTSLRPEHGAVCRHAYGDDGGVLQPRNVEGAAVHAHAVLRGADRRPPPPHRLPQRAGLRQAARTRSARSPRRRSTSTTPRRSGVLEMRAKARRLKAEHGLDLLIIDYLQLMRGRARLESREQEVSRRSPARSRRWPRSSSCPVMALSQLNRGVEQRGTDKRPQLSDLRESGAIEQDADVIMFIYRDEVYNKETQPRIRASPRSSSASSATARSAR